MSQPNSNSNNTYPAFNFSINDNFLDSHSTQASNPPFPQWTQPGTSPMGNRPIGSISSPSTSVRTPIPTPNPRSFNRSSIGQSPAFPLPPPEPRIDPSLALLNVPPPNRSRSAMDNSSNVDPFISRFYGAGIHDEPWSTERMRNSSVATGRSSFSQSGLNFGGYRDIPPSDIESIARSDSGYYTREARSVIGSEPDRVDQELPSGMTFQMHAINVNSASSEPGESYRLQSDQTSQYSAPSQGKTTHKCPKCKETSKCPSDFKKHMLKHDKPHTCDYPNCRRAAAGKGFTTINDLQRHKKSVHRIGVEKDSYQCASEHCRNRGKIWPRLDNFKQHISRMHKGEDDQDLIRRSVYHQAYPSPAEMSVAPMDTTLAGIGMEKQFPGNEHDDSSSGIRLTPDQDTSQWTFDSSSHSFATDVDQSNAGEDDQLLSNTSNSNRDSMLKFSTQQNVSVPSSAHSHSRPMRARQDSLSVLADVASNQVTPERPGPSSHRQLSSAPQTKAEQQRQALQKFSKVLVGEIQNASSAESVDLENVVMRVLYGSRNQNRVDNASPNHIPGSSTDEQGVDGDVDIIMTKAEAMKASQAISNLIKQSGTSPFASRPRRASKGFSNKLQCHLCEATLSRSCDMKKHMKRHTKPYGCTYPKCHKRFGAKSDWKRHENSQHFQLESFRCQLTSSSSQTPCGELFYRIEMFRSHLTSAHKLTEEARIQHELKARRIGKNGQGQFWCGFCQEIIRLKERRNAAWDERFDHIDHHFNKEKKSIEKWLCVEARKTKGEVLREMDKTNFDDEDLDEYDVGETGETPPEMGDGHEVPTQAHSGGLAASATMPPPMPSNTRPMSRKRHMNVDNPDGAPASKRRRDIDRYCCACENGPWLMNVYAHCMNCGHHLCGSCPIGGASVGLEGSIMLR